MVGEGGNGSQQSMVRTASYMSQRYESVSTQTDDDVDDDVEDDDDQDDDEEKKE